jgi:hypothetical protein
MPSSRGSPAPSLSTSATSTMRRGNPLIGDQAGVLDPAASAELPAELEYPADRLSSGRPLRHKTGERSLDLLCWGLVSCWSKDLKVGFANINAKAGGIETRPAFREAFKRRRCLVPVDNFCEWAETETGGQPHAIALADMALWRWRAFGKTGARRRTSGCAPSPSSPLSPTSCARSCTTACRGLQTRSQAGMARRGAG